MKKILFPFEIQNPIYQEAYVYAVKFARNLGAELIMLNVFEIEMDDSIIKKEYNKLISDHWLKAYKEVIRFNKYYMNNYLRLGPDLRIKVDYRFLHGNLINEIKKIIISEEVDLVVLPVSDQKEIIKKQIEIIRNDVFERKRVSLLVIPCKALYQPVKKLVFATDLKELHHYKLYLNEVIRVAEIFDASIHFLHISNREKAHPPESREVYKAIREIIEWNKRHVFRTCFGKDIISMVEEYIKKNEVELLAVVKHHHYFPETLFHKSFSNEVSLRSKVPVLVMREQV